MPYVSREINNNMLFHMICFGGKNIEYGKLAKKLK